MFCTGVVTTVELVISFLTYESESKKAPRRTDWTRVW